MKNRATLFILVSICLVISAQLVYAASTFLKIRPKLLNMGIINADDYENGCKEKISGSLIRLRDTANDWKLTVKTNDSDMGSINGYIKPIDDFSWKAKGSHATQIRYTSITNYDVEVARGSRSAKKLDIFTDYKIALSWARDIPGNYDITLVYTLTTQ
ncbi:MAG: hypothetical protein P9L93_00075 [Candidatus Gorgyraea atricola]|nr:hypothetical protein [Candidatus Gorgyraea atricola]